MENVTAAKPEHYIKVPEAVGVFDSYENLQAAMYDLLIAGFSRFDISMLAGEKALRERFGERFWQARELEDDAKAPRVTFVSEEAMGEYEGGIIGGFLFLGSYIAMAALLTPASTLAASIAAVAIGGAPAAAVGALLAHRVHKRHRDYYADEIKHGGILLWVRVRDKHHEEMAVKIMEGHSGRDVHVHDWSEP